ncbi:MAG: cupin domain-containing protein [Chloroflexi bacterium]|nr:cupin domain-containing protein [Chloroflexota bacterium]
MYTFIQNLIERLPELPDDSIISQTVFSDERTKVVLFGFAPGQELSEHTAARPAMLVFVEGEAEVVLGEDRHQAQAGTWVHMPPHLPHSITAQTRLVLLLVLL